LLKRKKKKGGVKGSEMWYNNGVTGSIRCCNGCT